MGGWKAEGGTPPVRKLDHPFFVAGLAHLWFVTIHPFDDGNGRIARAIADMALARSEGSAQRFYSMSAQIRRERSDYYTTLECTQKGGIDVTSWQERLQVHAEGSTESLDSFGIPRTP